MRATRTRERIIEAADALFGESGFNGATTRQIAEASGVNKALIHYHFKSKEELFDAILDRYYERLNGVMLKALSTEGDFREILTRTIEVYVEFLAANRSFSQMIQREAAGGRHLDRIQERTMPILQGAMAILEREFPLRKNDALAGPQLLISFYGMIVGYFTFSPVLKRLLGTDPLSKSSLERRKAHLSRMVELVFAELEKDNLDH